MSREDLKRYARHVELPEIGKAGQERIGKSSVLVVGLGGLGSAAAIYAVAGGVGTIGLADPDTVEPGNLQRQVLHSTEWLGKSKVDSAAARLKSLNPSVRLAAHRLRITRSNAAEIVSGYDAVIDALDSLADRYMLSDAVMAEGKPLVHGSVEGWKGEVCVFMAEGSPCLRCLYPEEREVPGEKTPAVFGPLAGIVGAIQASECLKLLAGAGRGLHGRILRIDALDSTFREFKLEADPACPACNSGERR